MVTPFVRLLPPVHSQDPHGGTPCESRLTLVRFVEQAHGFVNTAGTKLVAFTKSTDLVRLPSRDTGGIGERYGHTCWCFH